MNQESMPVVMCLLATYILSYPSLNNINALFVVLASGISHNAQCYPLLGISPVGIASHPQRMIKYLLLALNALYPYHQKQCLSPSMAPEPVIAPEPVERTFYE